MEKMFREPCDFGKILGKPRISGMILEEPIGS
jgi:hypothetical protein